MTGALDSLVLVGHAADEAALTGCTAVVFPDGAVAGCDLAGPASGTRELAVLMPDHLVERIHGVCFTGGSAFGLAAASGVMQRLEQQGIGHRTSNARVPIVCGAVVYDLGIGKATRRPDEAMGYAAADRALARAPMRSGNVGAGCGVSAGKLLGAACATKTGLGQALARDDTQGLLVFALVVLNPVGDVLDEQGRILAGTRKTPTSHELVDAARLIRSGTRCAPLGEHHTTLVLVSVNALLTRAEARWVAQQAMVGVARLVDPPFTRHDGDLAICASVGSLRADLHRVGILARDATQSALLDACRSADAAGALPSCRELVPLVREPLE